MKKGGSFTYLTKEGFRSLWSNRLMSVASIAVLMSCMIIIGCASMIFINMNGVLRHIEQQNVVMVFLEDTVGKEAADQVGEQIKALPNVKECTYVPKDSAWEKQMASLGEDAALLEGLGENPLPDAYRVTVSDLSQFQATVESLKKLPGVLSIQENSELAGKVMEMRRSVTAVAGVIIGMLLLVSLFIVSNTVRLTIFSRRLEISIMKDVGATDGFIRWPFMVEGMTIGVLSGLLSLGAVWGLYALGVKAFGGLLTTFGMSTAPFQAYAGWLLLGFVLLGLLTGVVGCAISMKRYLKDGGGNLG